MDDLEKDTETALTLGQRLKQLRELADMSEYELAGHLRLKRSIISAIEVDQQPAEVEDVFWRGYIRSFAKSVKMTDQELIHYLDEPYSSVHAAPQPMKGFSHKEKRKKSDKWLIILSVIIVIVIIALPICWWVKDNYKQDSSLSLNHSDVVSSPLLSSEQPQTPLNIPQSPNESHLSQERQPNVTQHQPSHGSSLDVVGATVTYNMAQPNPDQDTHNAVTQTIPSVESVPHSAARSDTQLANAQTVHSQVINHNRNSILRLKFNGDCWVKITDNESKTLFQGIKKAGDELSFDQKIDYHVVLGAPTEVEVTHKEVSVDLSRFINQHSIAKLTFMDD